MRRLHGPALAALTLTAALAGCGDDSSKDDGGGGASAKPTQVSMAIEPAGKKAEVSAPKSIKAGVVAVDFKNSTKKDAGLQFVRIEGDHTPAETIKLGNAWGDKGTPLPSWIRLAGGVPNAPAGTSETATQSLTPGKYLALELDGNEYAQFTVTGTSTAKVQAPTARISATEYRFNAGGLKAGKSEVLFANKGRQPHFVAGLPMNPGATLDDVRTFFKKDGKGKPPFSEKGGIDSPISDGGREQVLTLDLKKGKYALVCFIPDREGGPPHVAKGMISEAVVE